MSFRLSGSLPLGDGKAYNKVKLEKNFISSGDHP